MTKKKILLTGSGGMVGRNLLESPGINNFELVAPLRKELDLNDFNSVAAYLKSHKPDIVVHMAGKVGGIQANTQEPVNFLLENLDMGRNVVWASRQVGVKQLINLGSSCMYPRNNFEPLGEEMVLKGELEPTNEGYALAKVVTARLCKYIMEEDNSFQYKTLIPCNIYGRYDKFDPKCSHLIPAIIHKVHIAKQKKLPTIDIWGDGNARREFMYAGDLADAIVQAVKEFETLPAVMNLGLGYDYSINDYYKVTAELLGFKGNFVYDTTKPVGMARKLVSTKLQQAWGWSVKTDLRTGIEKTYQYYLEGLTQ